MVVRSTGPNRASSSPSPAKRPSTSFASLAKTILKHFKLVKPTKTASKLPSKLSPTLTNQSAQVNGLATASSTPTAPTV